MSRLSGKDLLRKLVREYSQDRWRKLVRELIEQELDEANSTASVGGSYNTPHAFGGSNKKGKKKGKAGYEGGHTEPTDGTGHFLADDPKLRKESIQEMTSRTKRDMENSFETSEDLDDFITKHQDSIPKSQWRKIDNYLDDIRDEEQGMKSSGWADPAKKGLKKILMRHIKESVVNEGRYHAWRNDESLSPRQKIGMAMRETRDNLTELERVVRYNVRLKNELKVDSRDYWKTTHKALSKISERLVRLANKVGQLH